MASTYSASLRLELMATGDQSGTWGDTTNTNLGTLLEQAITGVLSVAQGDVANLTLTALDGASDQSRNAVIDLTGALTAGRNVVVPTAEKLYLIKNSTTGGFAVTVKTAAGSGVTVPATTARWVYCDGTNVVDGMSGPWSPSSNDAQALGISGTAWADLFLASGGVVNWNAGDVTITHSANTLAFAGASSGYTFDALISGTTATFTGALTAGSFSLESTDAGATAAPILTLYRNSATPAANDILGQLMFNGEDSAGNTQEYASIEAIISAATSTAETGALDFYTVIAGARTRTMSVGPNVPNTTRQMVEGYATTATAAGTTTLVVGSAKNQYFTGSTTQTIVLPVTTTLPQTGWQTRIVNNSTGLLTVNSSGANLVVVVPPGLACVVTAVLVTGTDAASWDFKFGSTLTVGTAVASTSGTSIDFTGIPEWVQRVTMMFAEVSKNGTSIPIIQIGDSGGIEATGYAGASSNLAPGSLNTANFTTGFGLQANSTAASVWSGSLVLTLMDAATNTWTCMGMAGRSDAANQSVTSGSKALSGALTQVRLTCVNGTDAFDAGSVNISYE
jgi:hypothetical protein